MKFTGKKLTDSHLLDILGYLKNTQIWQSETRPNQGIPNQVPWLGLVSLQIWDFCGYSLSTLKYSRWESVIYIFFPVK